MLLLCVLPTSSQMRLRACQRSVVVLVECFSGRRGIRLGQRKHGVLLFYAIDGGLVGSGNGDRVGGSLHVGRRIEARRFAFIAQTLRINGRQH